jgi:lambda family phage portal protein
MSVPSILSSDGRPIDPQVIASVRGRAHASLTIPWQGRDGLYAYRAADMRGREVEGWNPWIKSPDSEINAHRDRMVARQRDLVRNDGWAAGGVDRIIDNTVGAHFRLIAKPDYMALGRADKRFDATWATEYGAAVEAEWRMWADDLGCFCDGGRTLDMTAIFRMAMRQDLIDGEALAYLMWLPDFVGSYGARYATTVLMVESDRLSNPNQIQDTAGMRGGVEIDQIGAPQAYYLRREEQNDPYLSAESMIWDRLPRETAFGRPVVIHAFEKERPTQHRGVSVLAPVLARFRMLGIYDQTELQSAVQQASIRTFITSPFSHDTLNSALSASDEGLPQYQMDRAEYHRSLHTSIGGARLPSLYPGESIQTVADDSKKSFADFEAAVLRSISSRFGLSEGQLSQDYSRTNYSSARAALLEAWKTMARRKGTFTRRFANPIYGAWLEEALATRLADVLPKGAPAFPEWRTAYARCNWLGPARGWIDPVRERQGAVLGLDAGFSTLERECAEQGLDWREAIQQRAVEIDMMKSLKIKLPDWAGLPAQQVETKPEPT